MTVDSQSNNKRIVKNTLMLYVRMFFIMIVTLYTSRVVLNVLGVDDFGIYNVVGGIVAMMGLLNSAMSSSIQRYYSFELGKGKGNLEQLKKTFSVSMYIYFLLCIIFVIVAESLGVWFLNNKLIIPEDRLVAANWVFQFSVLSIINQLLVNPFNATIIAHERMSIYAYVSILEAILRLVIVFVLPYIPVDSLALYGFLYFFMSLVISMIYRLYCLRNFEECKLHYYKDSKLFKELLSYCGWNIFGSSSALVKSQGLNILLNMFFNPSVNAARGIAYQINAAIQQFSSNFYTAVRPQITKYYAQGDLENMLMLVFKSSKWSFYLILFLSLPIIVETPYIVQLWLGQTPDYVITFSRLIIAITAVDGMAHPLMTTAHATGKIVLYQTSIGIATLLNLPISYVFLKLGFSPVSVFVISLIICILCLFIRLWIVYRLIKFPVLKYIRDVFGKVIVISITSSLLPLFLKNCVPDGTINSWIVMSSCLVSSLLVIFIFGFDKNERDFIKRFSKKMVRV